MGNKVLYSSEGCIATAEEEAYEWLLEHGIHDKYPDCLVGARGISFPDGSFCDMSHYVNIGEIPRHEPLLLQCFEELGDLFGDGISVKDIGEETSYYIVVDTDEDREIVVTPSMMIKIIKEEDE